SQAQGALGQSGDDSAGRPADGPSKGGPPGGARMPGAPGGGRPGMAGRPGGDGEGGPSPMPSNDPNMKKSMEASGAPSGFGGNKPPGTYMDIPKKYYTASTSDITVTIKSGEPLNIELKD